MRARAALLSLCLALSPFPAAGQEKAPPAKPAPKTKAKPAPPKPAPAKPAPGPRAVPPVLRYNSVSETMFLLERCGSLTSERRDWLDNVRGHAARAMEWSEAELATHDADLQREFGDRYRSVDRARCEELARNIDNERATTLKVPL
jgi:hypothetical protein